jgi:hypothetical protein
MTPFAADETISSGWTGSTYDLVVGINRWSYRSVSRDFASLWPLDGVAAPSGVDGILPRSPLPTSPGPAAFGGRLTGM